MPLVPWDDLQLCTVDDVRREITGLNLPFSSGDEAVRRQTVQSKIDMAKDDLRDDLLVTLPNLFVNAAVGAPWPFSYWATYTGYTYTELDTILDKISNPERLLPAAVSRTIVKLIEDGMMKARATMETGEQILAPLLRHWKDVDAKRLDRAIQLLRLDLNDDGVISDFERTRTHNTLWRS